MKPFLYTKVKSRSDAVDAMQLNSNGKFIGGGTNLVDLMKLNIETPESILDINDLDLKQIEELMMSFGVTQSLMNLQNIDCHLNFHVVVAKSWNGFPNSAIR